MQTWSLIFPTQSINYMFIPLMKNSLKLQLLVMMWEWCRDRDRGGRDYYSPSCSGSISWSESPCDDKHYRPNHNSKGPRQNDQSPRSKRNCGSDKRTFSPMRNDQSLRSPSPRENDRHKHGKKNQGSDRRSPSPRRYERSLSRSPSRSRSYRYLAIKVFDWIASKWLFYNLFLHQIQFVLWNNQIFNQFYCLGCNNVRYGHLNSTARNSNRLSYK